MPRTASISTIEAKIRELQARAEALKRHEKPGIHQLKAVLRKYRLTTDDIRFALGSAPTRPASKLKGKTLKPKYRNPSDKSQTWAGRGIRPRWLVAALKGGKKLDDFAI